MDLLKYLVKTGRRGTAKGRIRDPEWQRVDSQWEVNLYRYGGQEVLAIRRIWTESILATINLPAGTVKDAPRGWVRGLVMAIVKRAKNGAAGEPLSARVYTAWIKDHMRLWEYLTETAFADGSPRLTATLTVMAGDVSGVKMVLNDRSEGMALWATGADIPDCLDTLEVLLGDEAAPWKQDKRLNLKKGK